MAQFVNDYGARNILSKALTNQGQHSNLMVGQMAMHNLHGTSNIQLGQVQAAGANTNTAIGLMNLAQPPVFDNTNGSRLIAVKLIDNEGAKSITKVGEMDMINKGGKANISIAKAIAGGKGTMTEIGLLNLAEEEPEAEQKPAKKAKKEKKPKKEDSDDEEEKPKKAAKRAKKPKQEDSDDEEKPKKAAKKAKKPKQEDSDDEEEKPKKSAKKEKKPKQEDSDDEEKPKKAAKKEKKPKQEDSDDEEKPKKAAKKEKKPKKEDSDDDDQPLFLNIGGERNILLKELLAQGDKTITNVGELAMNNSKGKANISLAKVGNAGKGSLVNIGLLNLEGEQPAQKPAKKAKKEKKSKKEDSDDDDQLFINKKGSRNILLKELLAQGEGSKTNVGELLMDNSGGKANISLGKTANLGKGSLVNIGLLNLEGEQPAKKAQPMFVNQKGQRNILLKDFLAQGELSKSNIGEMAMDNTGGSANIQLAKAANAGKGSLVNIGLLNLAEKKAPAPIFMNTKGQRDILLSDMLNKGEGSIFKVGEMVMNNGQGVSNIKIGKSVNSGKGSESDIGLLML